MAQIKIIKKVAMEQAREDQQKAEAVEPIQKSRVSDWINDTRLANEARRMRDLKAFYGSALA